MKISLKVREERKPIVRAKLPLNVLGLPVFTGVTSGDQEELALHLGTDVRAGPSFRVSYKPNNSSSPFSVLVKTGFGLWGSPNGAALALSAEFDLHNTSGSPSFSVRLKPKFGDFGLQKDSPRFKASYEKVGSRLNGSRGSGDQLITVESGEPSAAAEAELVSSDHDADVQDDDLQGKGLVGTESGALGIERSDKFTNGILEKSDSFDRSTDTTPEKVKRINDPSPSDDEDVRYEQVAESDKTSVVPLSRRVEESTSAVRAVRSRFGGASKGWRFNAHSALHIGSWALAKVRWQTRFDSNVIHDVRQGMHITDIKLPSLTVDKVSFETLKRQKRSSAEVDLVGLGYGCEDTQLGRIAAMCSSMRYQIQLLHLENKLLKNTIDEWRGDLPSIRKSSSKGSELIMQEDTALRSQMFDELNGKFNSNGSGRSNGSGKNREGRNSGDSQSGSRPTNAKGTTSTGEEFSISKDPSEELQKAILNATGGGH